MTSACMNLKCNNETNKKKLTLRTTYIHNRYKLHMTKNCK